MTQQITVIGSTGHSGAHCYQWSQQFPNLTECDQIIVNVPTLDYATLDALYVKLGDAAYVRKMLTFQSQLSQFLSYGRVLVVIVDRLIRRRFTENITNMDWSPLGIGVVPVNPPGRRFAELKPSESAPFTNYLKMLKECRLDIRDISIRDDSPFHRHFNNPIPRSFKIHATHGGYQVAAGFSISGATRASDGDGAIFALHPLDKADQNLGIDALISALIGGTSHQPPTDIDKIVISGESDLRQQIGALNTQIGALEKGREELQAELGELRSFTELLYEYDDALDKIVRKAFAVLSLPAKKLPGRAHKEDFVICTDGRNIDAVVEVTGVEGQVNVKKARQLLDWLLSSDATPGVKGILVGNHYRKNAAGKSPEAFTKDAIRAAKGHEICLISSEDLFKAVCAKIEGKLDARDFVSKLLYTSGVFDLGTLLKVS